MYTVTKMIEISGAHSLELDYESKCKNMHGHNWTIEVTCQSEELNEDGMVIDFTVIKEFVNKLDHCCLNDLLGFNPTAENIAHFICENIPKCVKVKVQESKGNVAVYEKI